MGDRLGRPQGAVSFFSCRRGVGRCIIKYGMRGCMIQEGASMMMCFFCLLRLKNNNGSRTYLKGIPGDHSRHTHTHTHIYIYICMRHNDGCVVLPFFGCGHLSNLMVGSWLKTILSMTYCNSDGLSRGSCLRPPPCMGGCFLQRAGAALAQRQRQLHLVYLDAWPGILCQ